MFDDLEAALQTAEAAMAHLEPESLIGTQPAQAIDLLIRHERVTAAARLAMVARAEEMHPWQREGYRSFEEWLAAKEGTSQGQARRKTRTARKLRDHDRTADALADGDISEDEADLIADAADKNPHAEQELLDTAKNQNRSHKDLHDRAGRAKAAGEDERARADRLRRGRRAGWGVDRDGFWTLSGRFEPHVGAEMKARLAAETDRIFTTNRKAGTREPHDRYRADAVTNLVLGRPDHPDTDRHSCHDTTPTHGTTPAHHCANLDELRDTRTEHDASAPDAPQPTGPGDPADPAGGLRLPEPAAPTPAPNSGPAREPTTRPDSAPAPATTAPTPTPKELVLVVDVETLRRGCVRPGETCHIRGVGPVPVEVARRWVDDAFIKAVIRDGDDVRLVHHFGRTINARLRTALDLTESTCAVPRCDNPRLEYHHLDRHADMGPTSWWNLGRPCTHCHHLATHDGYRLAGTPGHRLWINPDGIVERADDPALVGHPPPIEPDPPPTGRQPSDTEPDRDTEPDVGIDLERIDTIEGFDQLVLIEPARAP